MKALNRYDNFITATLVNSRVNTKLKYDSSQIAKVCSFLMILCFIAVTFCYYMVPSSYVLILFLSVLLIQNIIVLLVNRFGWVMSAFYIIFTSIGILLCMAKSICGVESYIHLHLFSFMVGAGVLFYDGYPRWIIYALIATYLTLFISISPFDVNYAPYFNEINDTTRLIIHNFINFSIIILSAYGFYSTKTRSIIDKEIMKSQQEDLENYSNHIKKINEALVHDYDNDTNLILYYIEDLRKSTVDSNTIFTTLENHLNLSKEVFNSMYQTSDELYKTIKVSELLQRLSGKYMHKFSITFSIDDVDIESKKLKAMGIFINECLRNSQKHALSYVPELQVKIALTVKDGKMFELTYSDNGKGFNTVGSEKAKGMLILDTQAIIMGGVLSSISSGLGVTHVVKFN